MRASPQRQVDTYWNKSGEMSKTRPMSISLIKTGFSKITLCTVLSVMECIREKIMRHKCVLSQA